MSCSMGNSAGAEIIRTIAVHLRVSLLALVALLCLSACERAEHPKPPVNLLIVGILPGLTTYQPGSGSGPDALPASGFEYDLIERFAAEQKFVTQYVVAEDAGSLIELLRARKIHLAAGLQIGVNSDLLYSTPVREFRQVLVGNDDWSSDDLAGSRIEVLAHSPQLAALQRLAGTPPSFSIIEVTGLSEQDLLQRVADQKAELAASNMLNYRLAMSLYPDLVVVKELPDKIRSGWAFQRAHAGLAKQADAFIAAARKDNLLARLHDRYFGHIQRIKADGVARYIRDIHTVLPYYRKLFESAQASTGIDWRMIAALAYQESKWNPLATSFTNVRGLMMLTEETADRLGVDNRLDAAQSILGGGRYLAMLSEELPDDVAEPDRTWLALAAYNLGMGHLNGARTFARQLKRDPNAWYDMKKVLPLMSKPEYYSRLKAGPARGGEAVILVENVRNYYDILCRLEPAWQPSTSLLGHKDKGKSGKGFGGVRIGASLNKDPAKAQLRLPAAADDKQEEASGNDAAPATPATAPAAADVVEASSAPAAMSATATPDAAPAGLTLPAPPEAASKQP